MRSLKMSWSLIFFFLSFTFINFSESRPEKNLPSAVVVGTVYCDACFQEDFSKTSHFISGTSVAVECKDGDSKPSFREEVRTDKHGEFRVHLPFSVSKHVKKIKGCSVKLISSSEPYCGVASTATSSSLHLKSRKEGTHIFSAGFFTFKPLKQPTLCNQKLSVQNSKELINKTIASPTIFPPIQDPTMPVLPPLPPLPGLPILPPLPGKTTQSKPDEVLKKAQLSDQKVTHPEFFFPTPPISLPPNPFLPPPVLPPNQILLSPLLPPNRLLPPPAPLITFPPIHGLIPPLPPSFPFPLPPFPFPPSPRIPGFPPASSSKKASP